MVLHRMHILLSVIYPLLMRDLNKTMDQTLCPVLSSSLAIIGFNLMTQGGDAAFWEVGPAEAVVELG